MFKFGHLAPQVTRRRNTARLIIAFPLCRAAFSRRRRKDQDRFSLFLVWDNRPAKSKMQSASISFRRVNLFMQAVAISHYNVISDVLQVAAFNYVNPSADNPSDLNRFKPGDICGGGMPSLLSLLFVLLSAFKLHSNPPLPCDFPFSILVLCPDSLVLTVFPWLQIYTDSSLA